MLLFTSTVEEPQAGPGQWNDAGAAEHGGGYGVSGAAGVADRFLALPQQRRNPFYFPVHCFPLPKPETVILFLPH